MGRLKKGLIPLLGAVLVLAFVFMAIQPVEATEVWRQKFARFSATAGESLSIGDVVYIKSSDGEAYKADADDSSKRPAVGIIGKGGSADDTVEIVTHGILAGQSKTTPGLRLFLSTTAGAIIITGTAPTNEQCLGFVMPNPDDVDSSPIYYINVQMPQNDGAGY